MIEADRLSKIYGSSPAIEDVTFAVEAGEILGFLGPNGAGKTTTMRILTGYLPATSGTARIAGFDVHEDSMAVRQRIGYLPETPPLYPEMSVEGFLHFVAQIKGIAAGDRRDRVNTVLGQCGLLDKRRVTIRKLSKGFRQRVGIAQAIVHNPPVIILDEPTVGLDPRQIIEVRKLIESLAGDHTIILCSHILPEVSMTCTRVAIISGGRVVAIDRPDALMERLTGGLEYDLEVAANEGDLVLDTAVAIVLPEPLPSPAANDHDSPVPATEVLAETGAIATGAIADSERSVASEVAESGAIAESRGLESTDPESTQSEFVKSESGNLESTDSEPGNSEPGNLESTNSEPANPEPANLESTDSEPGNSEPGNLESTNSEPTNSEPANPEPANPEPANPEPGNSEPGNLESTDSEPGNSEPGNSEPGNSEPGNLESTDSASTKAQSMGSDAAEPLESAVAKSESPEPEPDPTASTVMESSLAREPRLSDRAEALLTTLALIPGISRVEPLLDHTQTKPHPDRLQVRLAASGPGEPGGAIAAAVVAAGLNLCEMRRRRASLEDVFLTLTTQDTAWTPESASPDSAKSDPAKPDPVPTSTALPDSDP